LVEYGDNLKDPKTFAFVHIGLKPLIVRMVELAFEKGGFRNIHKASKSSVVNNQSFYSNEFGAW
jgi:hypothetical protein